MRGGAVGGQGGRRGWRLVTTALAGDPAFGLFFPGGGLAGQGGVLAGAQSVDDDREVALPEFGGAAGVAQPDFGEKLEQEANVEEGDVVPQQAGSADPL